MAKKKSTLSCSIPGGKPIDKTSACCRVESIISIDERGQMVLP